MKEQYIDEYGVDSLQHLWEVVNASDTVTFVTLNTSMLDDREEIEQRVRDTTGKEIRIRRPDELLNENSK